MEATTPKLVPPPEDAPVPVGGRILGAAIGGLFTVAAIALCGAKIVQMPEAVAIAGFGLCLAEAAKDMCREKVSDILGHAVMGGFLAVIGGLAVHHSLKNIDANEALWSAPQARVECPQPSLPVSATGSKNSVINCH